jgi:hypothetical protein
LSFDDSIEEKPYKDYSELNCWHFVNCLGRSVRGLNFLTVFIEVGGMRLPVGVEFIKKDLWVTDSKSPTKTIKTQTNHYVLSIVAYIKLKFLKQRTKKNHFAMKAQIYLAAQQAAYKELKKLSTPRAA